MVSLDGSADSPGVCGAGWDQVISGALDEHKMEALHVNCYITKNLQATVAWN